MVHDVVHLLGQRFDGAEVGACALLVDALAFDPIFLTGDDNGGRSGLQELCKRGSVGHNVVSIPKGDVFDCKWGGVSCASGSRMGIFANTQQK